MNHYVFVNPQRQSRGVTAESLYHMLNSQNWRCTICRDYIDEQSPVDHCHTSGIVRGMLCLKCNSGLGMFKDNILILEQAIKYLERSRCC